MNAVRKTIALLSLVTTAAFGLTACGGVECGEGTTEQNGSCVTDTQTVCGEGTSPQNGACVLGDDGCGEGASYDSEAGTCLADPTACADPGTTFDEETGTCVAVAECGENTTKNDDGKCVPDRGELCSSGARDSNGECVPCSDMPGAVQVGDDGSCVLADGACGDGTQLSAESGTCIVAESGCGDGLALADDGTCQPTGNLCGDKASFDEEQGLCLPDQTCQPDDVVVDGICVSEAEKLARSDHAVSESENNDPAVTGSAQELTLPDNNDKRIVTGTINQPGDLDGDGAVEQDRDIFQISASAGDWFKVELHSTGLNSPFFFIEGPDGYTRWAPSVTTGSKARFFVAPTGGDYTITILPREIAQGPDRAGPIGSSDSTYVTAIQKLVDGQVPTAATNDISAGDQNLASSANDLTDNFYEVTNLDEDTMYELAAISAAPDADLVVQIWQDATTLSRTVDPVELDSRIALEDISGARFVLVDWKKSVGPKQDFDFEARQAGSTSTVTVDSGSTTTQTVEVDPFTRLEISQSNAADEDVSVEILDPNGNSVADLTIGGGDSEQHLTEAPGSYELQVSHEADQQLDVDMTVRKTAPRDFGALTRGNVDSFDIPTIDSDRRVPVKFTLQQGHVGALFPHTDSPLDDYDAKLYDAQATNLKQTTLNTPLKGTYNLSGGGSAHSLFWHTDQEQTFYGVFQSNGFGDVENLSIRGYATEPNDAGTVQAGDSNTVTFTPPTEETHSRFVKLEANSDIGVSISGTPANDDEQSEVVVNDGSLEVLADSSNSRIAAASTTANPTLDRILVEQGTAFVEVRALDTLSANYELQIDVTEPPITESEPNDGTGEATSGELSQKHLGSATESNEDYWQIDLAGDMGDQEVLMVDIFGDKISGGGFGFGPSPPSGWTCELMDGSSNTVVEQTEKTRGCLLLAQSLEQGTYYIRITNTEGSEQDYEMTFERTSDGIVETEPNDSTDEANSVSYTDFSGSVDLYGDATEDGDTDYFSLDLSSGMSQTETLIVTGEAIGQIPGDPSLKLLDDSDDVVSEGDKLIGRGLSAGTYYVELVDYTGDDGEYRLEGDVRTSDEVYSASPDTEIPDAQPSGINETLDASNCSTVDSVGVGLDITHERADDLQIELTDPNGNTVVLQQATAQGDAFSYRLYPVNFEPDESLSAFQGINGNGDWSLHVSDRDKDDQFGDGGTLESWLLELNCQ
jgi:subtilisin-like proprotein convertase family protein